MSLAYDASLKKFSNVFHLSKLETSKGTNYIPGGFSRRTFAYGPHAIFAQRGEAQYLHTIEGVRLLDLNNNFSTNVLGHNHPAIMAAIQEALPNGFSFGNPIDAELDLARLLCERIASIEQIKFFCSASEACLGAVRIARGYTGKQKIAKFEGGYHGFTDDLAISAHPDPNDSPGPDQDPRPLPDSQGIPSYKSEHVVILVQNDFETCERILRANAGEISCVLIELQAGAGGIVELDQQFVTQLRVLTKELGILLIVDETVTLRAAYGGLQGVYQVTPDLTVLGKIIGGGLPIGAVGGSREVFRVVEENRVMMSGTHHGHPLACTAGIACMQALDETAIQRLNSMAARIRSELTSWADQQGYPLTLIGGFSVMGYALTKAAGQRITTHRDYWNKVDDDSMGIYALEMAARGYFPVHRGQIGLTLPMTDDDVTGYIQTSQEVISLIYGKG